jgi:N-methylhydantoinase A/oxoprolinase/acetone carboxylase beta subunit
MRIGIDIGGTNIDAVLMDGARILASSKRETSGDVFVGVRAVLGALLADARLDRRDVDAVVVGTTQFMDAFVETRELELAAAVRLGLPATSLLPPFAGWPPALTRAVKGSTYLAHGGHEFDGRLISPLDADELQRIARDIAARGLATVVVSSVFSPINAELELQSAELLAGELGRDVRFSLSHEFGRIGLLERENAAIVNASLLRLADRAVQSLVVELERAGIAAPLYVSQNDGTVMSAERARHYPVATFASGPTNSMRGAVTLSGFENCIVVDVGGATIDVGVVAQGYPRQAIGDVALAGVRTSMRMPDVLSLPIGGASLVSAAGLRLGPQSAGGTLSRDALVFGGDQFTVTDAAVALGRLDIGDPSLVAGICPQVAAAALNTMETEVADAVERMRTTSAPLPVVVVGGGAELLPEALPGLGTLHRPKGFAVANAIGAAVARASGEVDKVYNLPSGGSETVANQARREAVDRAIAGGAHPGSVRLIEFDRIPVPYLPGNAIRIRAKAVGELAPGGA